MHAMQPRPIRRGEESLVQALIDRCYKGYGLVLNVNDECEQHLKDPGGYFRAHGGEFWVVPDERGEPCATAALYVYEGRSPRAAELKSMYVSPDYRRRGLGRMLTTMVMEEARKAGCEEIELWSDTRFHAAHAMYESLGFVRFGIKDVHDSNDSREWGYRRRL
jgi:putative acetyltransferase